MPDKELLELAAVEIAELVIKYKKAYDLTQARIRSDEFLSLSEADLDEIDTEEIIARLKLFKVIEKYIK